LREKQRFQQFFSQKMQETARFGAVFVYFGWHEGLFASFNSLHHHSMPRHSPHQ
jgi:hypothetical protein